MYLHMYTLLVDIPSMQVKNSRFKVFDRYLIMQVYLRERETVSQYLPDVNLLAIIVDRHMSHFCFV